VGVQKIIDDWIEGLKVNSSEEQVTKPDYVSDFLIEEWSPIWKRFQPPMWWVFRWAYSIRKRLFTNVYPTKISSGNELSSNDDMLNDEIIFTLDFKDCHSEKVDNLASELRDKFMNDSDIELPDPCKRCLLEIKKGD
jgi:hypothetical protein